MARSLQRFPKPAVLDREALSPCTLSDGDEAVDHAELTHRVSIELRGWRRCVG